MYSPIEALKFNWSSEAVYLCFYLPFKRNRISPNTISAVRLPMFLLVSAKNLQYTIWETWWSINEKYNYLRSYLIEFAYSVWQRKQYLATNK